MIQSNDQVVVGKVQEVQGYALFSVVASSPFWLFAHCGTIRQGQQEVRARKHELGGQHNHFDRRKAGDIFQQCIRILAEEGAVAMNFQPLRSAVDQLAELQLAKTMRQDLSPGSAA